MTTWKPKPGEDAAIRVVEVWGDTAYVTSHNIPMRVDDMRPLPVATLSAEDAAVRDLATILCALLVGRPPAVGPAVETAQQLQHALAAVRARAAGKAEVGTPHEPPQSYIDGIVHAALNWQPASVLVGDGSAQLKWAVDAYRMAPTTASQQIVAAREAVVSAALKQEHEDAACKGGRGMIPTYVAACIRTTEAARALRTILSPPTPPDPVQELREAATSVDAVIDGLLAEAAADVAGMTPARLHVATEAAHRLRAALGAMGEKG